MSALKDGFFLSVIAAFLLLATAWGLFLPVHEAPDEQNHYRYMIFLKEQGRLPLQLPLPPEVAGEGHQPPLYYWLGAAALKAWVPTAAWVELPNNPGFAFNRNPAWFVHFKEEGLLQFSGYAVGPHVLRIAQLWMPLLSLTALWLLLCSLPVKRSVACFVFAVFALNPGFVFLSGTLNNDHLVILFFSLTLLLLADAWCQNGWSWMQSLACGLFLGLGALSKISIFSLLPLALVMAWWLGSARKAALLGIVCAAIGLWFYVRNLQLYGDLFGWQMHLLTCKDTVQVKSLFDMGWLWFWLKRSFESFWIVFGWLSWTAPRWLNAVPLALMAAAGTGLLLRRQPSTVWMLLLALAFLTAGVVKFNWTFNPPEGRYFYPALLAIAGLTAFGLNRWKLSGWGPAALVAMAALNAWLVFGRLIHLYYNV